MKKLFFQAVIVAASAVIVVSFFTPWAKISASVTGVTKELTGYADKELGDAPVAGKVIKKLDQITSAISSMGDVDIKTTVRGVDIPTLVNAKSSKVALSLAQILFKSAEDIDKKSYLVYLSPLLAILCAVFAVFGTKNRVFVVLLLIISGILSIGGLYNLSTMTTTVSPGVKIIIQKGLWYTVYAYLAIFLAGIAWLASERKK